MASELVEAVQAMVEGTEQWEASEAVGELLYHCALTHHNQDTFVTSDEVDDFIAGLKAFGYVIREADNGDR